MLILDSIEKSLEIVLAGAITTNQLSVTTVYYNNGSQQPTLPTSLQTSTNNSTPVTIIPSPASGTQNNIDTIIVQNKDTQPAKITLQINVNGTEYPLLTATLSAGDNFKYANGEFKILDSNGNIKVNTSGLALPLSPANGGTGVANNAANTITFTGAYSLALNLTANTSLTLPTSGTVATIANSETFTNKRITKRLQTVTFNAAPTYNTDNYDIFFMTLTAAVTNFSTNLSGTPVKGDMFMWQLIDNGTARALSWGASFGSTQAFTLPSTTVISTLLRCLFQWNDSNSLWELIGLD